MESIFTKSKRTKNRKVCDSVYSVVSSSDLTPGSVEVWRELPDDIKFDPALAPFKRLYEQHHGKLNELEIGEAEKDVFGENGELSTVEEIKTNLGEDCLPNGENRLLEASQTKNHPNKSKKFVKAMRIIKLSALIGCWILLTVALVLNRENTDDSLHTAVIPGFDKIYELRSDKQVNRLAISISLIGPFIDTRGNDSNSLSIWLQRSAEEYSDKQNSSYWEVILQAENALDFSPGVKVSKTLVLDLRGAPSNGSKSEAIVDDTGNAVNGTSITLRMRTTGNVTVPLTLSYHLNPVEETEGTIYAAVLLCILYVLIIFEIVNRTIAALLVSTLSVAVLALCGVRPTLQELVSWLDVETLLLLLSMMLIVAMVAETGLFDCLAVYAFEVTGGRTWPLITCLCLFTAVSSTFLDNVTTVLLVTPITIRLCEVMQLNPVPVLMSMVIFSNVGGAATPVGDPPNVIIASHPSVLSQNINFTTFTAHMAVGILLVGVQTYLQIRYMFRDIKKLRHSVPAHILELQQEIAAWRRAASSLSAYSKDEDVVKRALEKKVDKLNIMLSKREAGRGMSKSDPKFYTTLAQMKQKYHIRDKELLIKSIISITFVVVVFFLHAFPALQKLSLGWTALLGALLLLLLAERDDLEPILARVEWSTLLFFAALFVLMEALSKLGLISWIGENTKSIIMQVDEKSRLAVAIMLVLWVSGLASAFVDNIPLTTMMVRVTAALADPSGLALPLAPLAWALSFGACLGGNGTLIGASANVVCAGVAEQHGYKITFMEYLKIGFPIMMGNLIVASVYLLFCHCVFQWH